jgi:hypothetical protein
MQMTRFANIPLDPETRIISKIEIIIDKIPALIEQWSWDGIAGKSAIFIDVDVSNYSDEELFLKIVEHFNISSDTRHTVQRNSNGFTFVNFDFFY